jgi:hypothetical protein
MPKVKKLQIFQFKRNQLTKMALIVVGLDEILDRSNRIAGCIDVIVRESSLRFKVTIEHLATGLVVFIETLQ